MAILLFTTAFVLSGIAAYYSVMGLIAIFAASAIPVAIMGGSLEIAKLVVASWLYRYWSHIPFLMKTYFTSSLVILMLITSMGIFGFLSKAHIEQGVPTGDIASQIAVIDEKIKIERDNIDNYRALISQLDGVVNAMTSGQDRTSKRKDGSEIVISSAERALSVRRSQSKDRDALTKQVEQAQTTIIELQKERAPIASSLREIEAEVGPIKYIAAMVYGDDPDQNTLEKSVRWLIILLICVFDPLAVLMLIGANLTQLKRDEWKVKEDIVQPVVEADVPTVVPDAVVNISDTVVPDIKVTEKTHPYLYKGDFWKKPEGWFDVGPMVATKVNDITTTEVSKEEVVVDSAEKDVYNKSNVAVSDSKKKSKNLKK